MMEGISGLKMAQLLREDYHNDVPIIFISALDNEVDIVDGFNKGGDDYIPKPFSIKEVLARINAVLNRCYPAVPGSSSQDEQKTGQAKGAASKDDAFIHEGLKIEYAKKMVMADGEEISLTKKEYEILLLLTKSPGKIYSREDILQLVWKEESYVLERTVDVHIARLRKKIGRYGDLIVNRSGYGYSIHL
jgi:DNA-binding response OmpR family regulator